MINIGLRYTSIDVRIHGYTNADGDGNIIDRKITSSFFFSLGSAKISWMTMKQNYVVLSTIEEKYIVVSMARCKEIFLRKLFGDIF